MTPLLILACLLASATANLSVLPPNAASLPSASLGPTASLVLSTGSIIPQKPLAAVQAATQSQRTVNTAGTTPTTLPAVKTPAAVQQNSLRAKWLFWKENPLSIKSARVSPSKFAATASLRWPNAAAAATATAAPMQSRQQAYASARMSMGRVPSYSGRPRDVPATASQRDIAKARFLSMKQQLSERILKAKAAGRLTSVRAAPNTPAPGNAQAPAAGASQTQLTTNPAHPLNGGNGRGSKASFGSNGSFGFDEEEHEGEEGREPHGRSRHYEHEREREREREERQIKREKEQQKQQMRMNVYQQRGQLIQQQGQQWGSLSGMSSGIGGQLNAMAMQHGGGMMPGAINQLTQQYASAGTGVSALGTVLPMARTVSPATSAAAAAKSSALPSSAFGAGASNSTKSSLFGLDDEDDMGFFGKSGKKTNSTSRLSSLFSDFSSPSASTTNTTQIAKKAPTPSDPTFSFSSSAHKKATKPAFSRSDAMKSQRSN